MGKFAVMNRQESHLLEPRHLRRLEQFSADARYDGACLLFGPGPIALSAARLVPSFVLSATGIPVLEDLSVRMSGVQLLAFSADGGGVLREGESWDPPSRIELIIESEGWLTSRVLIRGARFRMCSRCALELSDLWS